MTEEKWQEIIGKIKDRFEVLAEEESELENSPGSREAIVFNSPLGEVKLERIQKPKVKEEKTITSRRIGAAVRVEKIYEADATVSYLKAYKKVDGLWQQIDSADFLA